MDRGVAQQRDERGLERGLDLGSLVRLRLCEHFGEFLAGKSDEGLARSRRALKDAVAHRAHDRGDPRTRQGAAEHARMGTMRGMLILWAVGSGLAACGATPSRTPAPSQLSEEACEPLHEALSDEHQRDVHDWSERARLAQDAASREVARAEAQALTRRYRDRFQVLADQGCGRARVQVLDLLGHIEPIDEDQVAGALEMLSLVASEDRDAWWISDIADNDVVRYFLRGPARVAAKEVLIDLAASTHDEEAQRGVLYELGYGLIQIRGTEQEREEGLLLLDRVAALWPGSREARQASALTRNTREMRIGAPMPTLAGSTADGEAATTPGPLQPGGRRRLLRLLVQALQGGAARAEGAGRALPRTTPSRCSV